MKTIRYTLSDEDRQQSWRSALDRASAAAVTEAEAVKLGTYDPLEVELIGMMAEIAVCRVYGVEPDLNIYSKRSDGGADITYKGYTANIKATKYFKRPHLIVRTYDDKYDVYILCSVKADSGFVEIHGYATKKQIQEKIPSGFKGSQKKSKVIPYEELRELKGV